MGIEARMIVLAPLDGDPLRKAYTFYRLCGIIHDPHGGGVEGRADEEDRG